MKTITKVIFCFIAAMTLCASACENDNEGDGTNNESSYNEMIVGTWLVDNVSFNGESMTPENMLIIMNSDGSGLFNDNGVTENNEFTWSITGDQLTIVHRTGSPVYTINSLTDSECTITGNTIPGQDEMTGDVVMHMTKQS